MAEKDVLSTDVLIVGSGPGGGTLANALRNRGASVLLVEKGDFLPSEPENWDPVANFVEKRYKADVEWVDGRTGTTFRPNLYQYVGGCSKVWGTVLARFRSDDFGEMRHSDGLSPAWPIKYEDMAKYYDNAEVLYGAHGGPSVDPTAPPGQPPAPHSFVGHSPTVARIAASMTKAGLHPFELPVGVDRGDGGGCVLCSTCDGFPCHVRAKNDAEMRAVRPALMSPNVTLSVRTTIDRLVTTEDGKRVVAAVGTRDGHPIEIRAERFVISAGAAMSAAILLRSASPAHPEGLANGSGQLGRNYMQHVFTALLAVDPWRKTNISFQKTVGLNDHYLDSDAGYPLGNIQTLGKLSAEMLKSAAPWAPRSVLRFMSEHGTDWWATTEDLPRAENRVTLDGHDRIVLSYQKNNLRAHDALVRKARRHLRQAGFPFVFARPMPIETTAAQCGTARFGEDPSRSVLDPYCRTHEVANLWVVDASFMPSCAAQNPGLTIAANALRVGDVAGIAD